MGSVSVIPTTPDVGGSQVFLEAQYVINTAISKAEIAYTDAKNYLTEIENLIVGYNVQGINGKVSDAIGINEDKSLSKKQIENIFQPKDDSRGRKIF
jgi:hypothetical protein